MRSVPETMFHKDKFIAENQNVIIVLRYYTIRYVQLIASHWNMKTAINAFGSRQHTIVRTSRSTDISSVMSRRTGGHSVV